ncbi:HIT finger domain protein [Aspergillus avenaceus]|uniref:HIT finger domain protein n=1 Tax=Aspergillus avenaceus TaxID=36643 RepID=A0A5N6TIH0_ASPAV|nr:HIT finger domain protein [Aspergillus avenaceus]
MVALTYFSWTSCSLACTQSHKIYCAPKEAPPKEETDNHTPPDQANGQTGDQVQDHEVQNRHDPQALASSPQLKELFDRYHALRDELREIYKATLEEEWVETQIQRRPFGRGKPIQRNRGPWTREKGFNRGLGKVRKLRERCEEGLETGKSAESYMQFRALVNPEQSSHEPA